MATKVADTEFTFDLIFALPDDAADEAAILDSLYETGCDDAVVGLGAPGSVGLGFKRAGREAEAVVAAAVRQVMSGLPEGAILRDVRMDAVSPA